MTNTDLPLPNNTPGTYKLYATAVKNLNVYLVEVRGEKLAVKSLLSSIPGASVDPHCATLPLWFKEALEIYNNHPVTPKLSFQSYILKITKSLPQVRQWGLIPGVTYAANKWANDFDYIEDLDPEAREWLNQFSRGYYQNTFDDQNEHIYTSQEEKRKVYSAYNSAARDIYSKLQVGGLLTDLDSVSQTLIGSQEKQEEPTKQNKVLDQWLSKKFKVMKKRAKKSSKRNQ